MSTLQLKSLLAGKQVERLSRTISSATQDDMGDERMKELEAALEAANKTSSWKPQIQKMVSMRKTWGQNLTVTS